MDIGILTHPHVQLYLYITYLAGVIVISRVELSTVLTHGLTLLILWMAVSLFAGVPPSVDWGYYLAITFCLLMGYVFFLGVAGVVEKYGRGYANEGFMAVLAPLPIYLMIIVPACLLKLVWQLIAEYT